MSDYQFIEYKQGIKTISPEPGGAGADGVMDNFKAIADSLDSKNAVNGYAGLDESGKLDATQFPSSFQIQLRRGTAAEIAATILAEGEPAYATDTGDLYIGDGSTTGGILVSVGRILDSETINIGSSNVFNATPSDAIAIGNSNVVGLEGTATTPYVSKSTVIGQDNIVNGYYDDGYPQFISSNYVPIVVGIANRTYGGISIGNANITGQLGVGIGYGNYDLSSADGRNINCISCDAAGESSTPDGYHFLADTLNTFLSSYWIDNNQYIVGQRLILFNYSTNGKDIDNERYGSYEISISSVIITAVEDQGAYWLITHTLDPFQASIAANDYQYHAVGPITFTNLIADKLISTPGGVESDASGYNTIIGFGASVVGYTSATSGQNRSTAIGYGARNSSIGTVNLGGPIVSRKYTNDIIFPEQQLASAEVYLRSPYVNFKAVSTYPITIEVPYGSTFFPTECGIICTAKTNFTIVTQPSISLGVSSAYNTYRANAVTTALTAIRSWERTSISLTTSALGDGNIFLGGNVNTAATSSGSPGVYGGHFYFKGYLMEI